VECGIRSLECKDSHLLNKICRCDFSSIKRGMQGGKCRVRSVKCKVPRVECGVRNVTCRVWSVKCRVWSAKCKV
jgi:hypothetical protein